MAAKRGERMIDEKKLIEDLEEQYKNLIPEDDTDFCKIWQIKQDIKIIEAQPQVGEWIPVSERLPETDDLMLVSCRTKKGINSVNRAYYSNGAWHGSGSMSGVVAWMPLPEPYKGGEKE